MNQQETLIQHCFPGQGVIRETLTDINEEH